jgi:hypothetical protein
MTTANPIVNTSTMFKWDRSSQSSDTPVSGLSHEIPDLLLIFSRQSPFAFRQVVHRQLHSVTSRKNSVSSRSSSSAPSLTIHRTRWALPTKPAIGEHRQ